MASIYKRNSSYAVIYYYTDESGVLKQKWESYKTKEQACRRKHEVENPFLLPETPRRITTVDDLMEQFFTLYGTMHWTYSTAGNYASLKRRFISPFIGTKHMQELTGLHIAALYQRLAKSGKSYPPVRKSTLRDLHKLLKCAFHQAVVWGVLEHSPLDNIAIPKEKRQRKPVWVSSQVRQAVRACGSDSLLSLAIQLAFACSLRMGELLALKWSDVDFEKKTVHISKTMQRISRETVALIGTKGIIETLPCEYDDSRTLLVIKAPKTEASIRTVFLPDQLAAELLNYKRQTKRETDSFILRLRNGKPLQPECLRKRFRTLIDKAKLPRVTFHSLRHSNVTYKLMLTHGNIKAVQGDTGHAQANMVLEVYAEILDNERMKTAMLMNEDWYGQGC